MPDIVLAGRSLGQVDPNCNQHQQEAFALRVSKQFAVFAAKLISTPIFGEASRTQLDVFNKQSC